MRAPVLPAVLLCLCACPAREPPSPSPTRTHAKPTTPQPQPVEPVDPAKAALEVIDVQLRAGRTRMNEAVRMHVSAWRDSAAPGFSPTVELLGPAKATVERVGEEIVEEQDGRVRERVDFLIEPGEPGTISISVLGATTTGEQRQELTLLVGEPLPASELKKQLATRTGQLERGRALAKQGDYNRALEAFNLALEQQRDDPVVLGEVGWAAFLSGDLSLARRATREALRIETEAKARGSLLYNLGRIAEALDRSDEAIVAYQRSLAARPDSETVRKRLAKLAADRPAPTCVGPSCPLTPPVASLRACELIEEEGCPLFRQRGACSCDAEALSKLDPIGPWRLLTLTERDRETGPHHVYILLADASAEGDEPRYHVFVPLPGSQVAGGPLRGGVRAAEMIKAGELELLRIDFEGTVTTEEAELARAWTLLCAFVAADRPVCAPPLLSRHHAPDKLAFEAPIVIGKDGSVSQTIESGTAPSRSELDTLLPGARMQVVTRPISLESLFAHAG